jgi:hypothetical protein
MRNHELSLRNKKFPINRDTAFTNWRKGQFSIYRFHTGHCRLHQHPRNSTRQLSVNVGSVTKHINRDTAFTNWREKAKSQYTDSIQDTADSTSTWGTPPNSCLWMWAQRPNANIFRRPAPSWQVNSTFSQSQQPSRPSFGPRTPRFVNGLYLG